MAWQHGRAWTGGSTRAWRTTRASALRRDNHLCQVRGPHCTGDATEVDHIINKAAGGTDELTNLRSVCPPCHRDLTAAQAAAGRAHRSARRPTEPHPGLR